MTCDCTELRSNMEAVTRGICKFASFNGGFLSWMNAESWYKLGTLEKKKSLVLKTDEILKAAYFVGILILLDFSAVFVCKMKYVFYLKLVQSDSESCKV